MTIVAQRKRVASPVEARESEREETSNTYGRRGGHSRCIKADLGIRSQTVGSGHWRQQTRLPPKRAGEAMAAQRAGEGDEGGSATTGTRPDGALCLAALGAERWPTRARGCDMLGKLASDRMSQPERDRINARLKAGQQAWQGREGSGK